MLGGTTQAGLAPPRPPAPYHSSAPAPYRSSAPAPVSAASYAPPPAPPVLGGMDETETTRLPSVVPAATTSTSLAPTTSPPLLAVAGLSPQRLAIAGGALAAVVLLVVLLSGSSTGQLTVTVAGPGNSPVSGVQVFVNGEKKCDKSPCTIPDLEEGTLLVRAQAEGYEETTEQAVQLGGGEQAAHNIVFDERSRVRPTGLQIAASTLPLTLSVDGKEIGPLPQTLEGLTPGEHQLTFNGGNKYESATQKINVVDGAMTAVTPPQLAVSKGILHLEAGPGSENAKVFVDAKRVTLPAKIELDGSKEHRVTASQAGGGTFSETVSFEDGKAEQSLTITLAAAEDEADDEPAPSAAPAARRSSAPRSTAKSSRRSAPAKASGGGTLNINSIPASKVILDGRTLGSTPRLNVPVSAGSHSVVFVHPKKGRKSASVSVPKGGRKTVAVRFK